MRSLTISSPAKLNLTLRLIGRLPGGYHEIFTLFHRISLADTLQIRKRGAKGCRLRTDYEGLPVDSRNLIVRAYELLSCRCPHLGGVEVRLTKRIPVGAGLGGGSSNAASFLLAMNRLYHLGLSRRSLLALGKKLGADVPFFLKEISQGLGTGRGDRLKEVAGGRKLWFLLVLSNQALSTADVYRGFRFSGPRPSLTKEGATVRILCNFLRAGELGEAAHLLHNDLESPAFRLRPGIRRTLTVLKKLGHGAARMSGSGPTVFAIFNQPQEAKRLAMKLRPQFPPGAIVVCHSL